MKEYLCFVFALGLAFALLFALAAGFEIVYQKSYCNTMGELHGDAYQFQWVLWGGCLVQTPQGRWIDADDYFQIEGVFDE